MTTTPDILPSLLSAQVSVRYPGKAPVLRDVSLEIARGEIVGLVGQSGSGKSTLALAILGLLGRQRAIVEGKIIFQGADLLTMRERELRNLRGRSLSLVLQSPLASLNPALQIRTQLREAWRAHSDSNAAGITKNEDCDRAIQSALKSVSLPTDRLGGFALRRTLDHAVLRPRGNRLRLCRSLLCRICVDDPNRRLRIHLWLRHAGRNCRLDHRLGSDFGIRFWRCNGRQRLEQHAGCLPARLRHQSPTANLRCS